MATATCSLGTFDSFFFTLLMIVILSLSLYHSLPYSIDLPWPCADRHVHNSDLMAVLREAATSPGMFFSATGDETIGESSCAFERAPRSVGRLLRFGSSREVFPRSRVIYSYLISLRWGSLGVRKKRTRHNKGSLAFLNRAVRRLDQKCRVF
jgi:hypothetical protein